MVFIYVTRSILERKRKLYDIIYGMLIVPVSDGHDMNGRVFNKTYEYWVILMIGVIV